MGMLLTMAKLGQKLFRELRGQWPNNGGDTYMKNSLMKTCGDCDAVVAEKWPKGKTALRCSAPGAYRGYVVGFDRPLPYIPAWCPKLRNTKEGKV